MDFQFAQVGSKYTFNGRYEGQFIAEVLEKFLHSEYGWALKIVTDGGKTMTIAESEPPPNYYWIVGLVDGSHVIDKPSGLYYSWEASDEELNQALNDYDLRIKYSDEDET